MTVTVVSHGEPRRGPWQANIVHWSDSDCRLQLRQVDVHIDWASGQCVWTWPPLPPESRADVLVGPALMATLLALAHRAGGVVVHGAGLLGSSNEGCGVLVCGASGAGKSTLSARFPGRCVQDDTCIVAPGPAGWQLWYQDAVRVGPRPAQVPAWGSVPLRTLFHLGPDRARSARKPISQAEAFGRLVQQAYHPGSLRMPQQLDTVARLVHDLPSYELSHCLGDPPVVLDDLLFGGPSAPPP